MAYELWYPSSRHKKEAGAYFPPITRERLNAREPRRKHCGGQRQTTTHTAAEGAGRDSRRTHARPTCASKPHTTMQRGVHTKGGDRQRVHGPRQQGSGCRSPPATLHTRPPGRRRAGGHAANCSRVGIASQQEAGDVELRLRARHKERSVRGRQERWAGRGRDQGAPASVEVARSRSRMSSWTVQVRRLGLLPLGLQTRRWAA